MSGPIANAGIYLINIIFDLYLLLLMVRLILFWASANYFNPITQVILKLTNPMIIPVRRFVRNIGKLETSTLIVLLLVEIVKYILTGFISYGLFESFLGILILALADSLKLLLDTFFYAILLKAIMSWIQSNNTPIAELLSQMTSPLMRPFQRIIPLIAGMDISPIPVMILLQLLIILLVNPLMNLGIGISFG
jgi:YggT family protein